MKPNILGVISLSFALSTALFSQSKVIDSSSNSTPHKEGFYFYKDPQDSNKTKEVPVSPQQKMQADMMSELIKQMKKNNELQEKILEKLEYAFPRTTPEYTVNKKTGEKCKTNSSADCFVMPVITEAQNSVPAMAQMLRNPTQENVKNYMEWQAVYLNQAFKIGQGFSLVSKQYEREVNKIDGMSYTQMPLNSSKQNDIQYIKMSAVIEKLGDKLGLMVFAGKSKEHEREMNGRDYIDFLHSVFGKMKNLTYVFASNEDEQYVSNKIQKFRYSDDFELYSKVKKTIDASQFERFKINVTPASVIIYKKDDGTVVWQKVGYTMRSRDILRTTYQFLQFHNIIKPGTINEKDNWQAAESLRSGNGIGNSIIKSIDINESSFNPSPDQILIKGSKK